MSLRSGRFYKIDGIQYVDSRYSLFDVRHSHFYSFCFDLTGRPQPAAALDPGALNGPAKIKGELQIC
jgi:hypothetical protein